MKGIILAGGRGTRLYPLTLAISKHLLPIYDAPMIFYPLGVLLAVGIRDVLVICTPEGKPHFRRLLRDGADWGMHLSYAEQPYPGGLAQAYTIGADFARGGPSALILGDNLFFGADFTRLLAESRQHTAGARLFAYPVDDPQRYGIVELDRDGRAVSLVEKPSHPKSRWAVTGLYFYDESVIDVVAGLRPSPRGELEITDVNGHYLERGALAVTRLDGRCTWFDAGTPESLLEASNFVRAARQEGANGIPRLEEVAFLRGLITRDQLARLALRGVGSDYGEHLGRLASAGP